MRVRLKDIVFDYLGESGAILQPPVEGLSLPEIRMAGDDYSGRDGGYVDSQFFSRRKIGLRGVVHGKTAPQAASRLSDIFNDFKIREALPLFVTPEGGDTYFAQVYIADMKMDIDRDLVHRFDLLLIAEDSYLYLADEDDPDAGWNTEPILEPTGGGYPTPYVLPVEWEDGGQPTLINNPTGQLALPQIIIEGANTNPKVTNLTTGEFVQVNVTTTAGDKIVIDMKDRTVTLNGGSILPAMTGSWWGLVQGNNTLELMTDDGGDDKVASIRYRIPYTGIYGAS